MEIRIESAALIAGLSRALDLTEGEPMGHSLRVCWLGMRLAAQYGINASTADDLYYALLLKDAGCSANAAQVSSWFGMDDHEAKMDLKLVNWSRMHQAVIYAVRHAAPGQPFPRRLAQMVQLSGRGLKSAQKLVETRCTRGAAIVRALGWSGDVPEAVLNLDEHWDGSGYPLGVRGADIPFMARVMLLCQTAEIFWRRQGPDACRRVIADRRGSWFDPALVDVFLDQSRDPEFFSQWAAVQGPHDIQGGFPKLSEGFHDLSSVAHIAEVFGQIVDAKSPWTRMHSIRTAHYARRIAEGLSMDADEQQSVLLAGYFHDLGKLGVSNVILDKPGALSAEERQSMERHAALTYEVLAPLDALESIAYAASCHHERLDGSGYHRRLSGSAIPTVSQVVAVADVFDALTAERPYRAGLSREEAYRIMLPDAGTRLNGAALEVLMGMDPLEALPDELGLSRA